MTSKPFVSIRKHIKQGDKPPFEDTRTVVLTTPLKNYIDIRTILSVPVVPHSAHHLQWAFAGPSISITATSSSPAHTRWIHWLDSTIEEEIEDEGWMYPIEGTNLVLEKGENVLSNEEKEEYEELWEDLELVGRKGWVLKLDRVEGEGKGKVKGMVIRVGEWMQGVLRTGIGVVKKEEEGKGDYCVARWKLSETEGWVKEVGIGELEIGEEIFGEGDFKEGDGVREPAGLEWKCVESFAWE